MHQINLLPWREQQREQKIKYFLGVLIGFVLVAVLLIVLINFYACNRLHQQRFINQILNTEIMSYAKQVKKIKNLKKSREKLIYQIMDAANLETKRSFLLQLLAVLNQLIPVEIYLTHLVGQNNFITLAGSTKSNAAISQLMISLQNSKWIHNPVLKEIKQQVHECGFKLIFIFNPQFSQG